MHQTWSINYNAKEKNIIKEIRPVLDEMVQKGRWYSDRVVIKFLREVGEWIIIIISVCICVCPRFIRMKSVWAWGVFFAVRVKRRFDPFFDWGIFKIENQWDQGWENSWKMGWKSQWENSWDTFKSELIISHRHTQMNTDKSSIDTSYRFCGQNGFLTLQSDKAFYSARSAG